jgi:hypothetical protein
MDILEASAKLERIELLAKIAHVEQVTLSEKKVALEWIGELAGELSVEIRDGIICSRFEKSLIEICNL